MRLSRNRNWGHPSLVQFLERLAAQAPKTGWQGLLVGSLSQPRGGPMLTGHASHQVGLDADIWLSPMPNRELTRQEREEMSATMIVAEDRLDVDPQVCFFFQAEDGIRDIGVTGVQTCALPI